jgi:hypothetical protein
MTITQTALSFMLTLISGICSSCANTPGLTGIDASTDNTEKTLIPHPSWTCSMPNGIPRPETGVLVFEAEMKLDQVCDVGKTPYGLRQVFVIQRGTVTGDKIQGSILPGGLDFQLTLSNDVIEIEQVLVIRTNEGNYIYLRNAGTGVNEKDIRIVMDFEAPNDSSSAWLNTGSYVARRTIDLAAKSLKMTVYDVSEAAAKIDITGIVKISKPAGIPQQPWDYRKASPSEKQDEQIIRETVTLGASTSVGISKRGPRNIIPITGGTLTGKINGKVLAGGADYQNFSNPATLDARYLWQTDDGDIIIVRNAGVFGSLVPAFEARIDGKYSWLNGGTYLSSNPELSGGSVKLTMYQSK